MIETVLAAAIFAWAGYFLWKTFRPKKTSSCGSCSCGGSGQGCGLKMTPEK